MGLVLFVIFYFSSVTMVFVLSSFLGTISVSFFESIYVPFLTLFVSFSMTCEELVVIFSKVLFTCTLESSFSFLVLIIFAGEVIFPFPAISCLSLCSVLLFPGPVSFLSSVRTSNGSTYPCRFLPGKVVFLFTSKLFLSACS